MITLDSFAGALLSVAVPVLIAIAFGQVSFWAWIMYAVRRFNRRHGLPSRALRGDGLHRLIITKSGSFFAYDDDPEFGLDNLSELGRLGPLRRWERDALWYYAKRAKLNWEQVTVGQKQK